MQLQKSPPGINTVVQTGVPTVLLDSNMDEDKIIIGDEDELMLEAYTSVAAAALGGPAP